MKKKMTKKQKKAFKQGQLYAIRKLLRNHLLITTEGYSTGTAAKRPVDIDDDDQIFYILKYECPL